MSVANKTPANESPGDATIYSLYYDIEHEIESAHAIAACPNRLDSVKHPHDSGHIEYSNP